MARLLLGLLCLTALGVQAVEPMEGRVAQRLEFIHREEAIEVRIEKLQRYAAVGEYSPDQKGYIVMELAVTLAEAERLAEARAALQGLIDQNPPDYFPNVQLMLARLLLMLDEVDEALTVLENWRQHELSPEPQALFLMGYVYLRTERFEDAVSVLEPIVRGSTDVEPRPSWIELLSYAYAQVGRIGESIELMLGLVSGSPDNSRRWKQLSTFYQMNEDTERGTAALVIARELSNLKPSETVILARMFAYIGMPYDGAVLLEGMLAGSPREEFLYEDHLLLARLWSQSREYDAALESLERAREFADDGRAWLTTGQIHLHREQYHSALNAFRSAIIAFQAEDVPDNLHYLLALTAVNLNQPKLAREHLDKLAGNEQFARRRTNLMRFIGGL